MVTEHVAGVVAFGGLVSLHINEIRSKRVVPVLGLDPAMRFVETACWSIFCEALEAGRPSKLALSGCQKLASNSAAPRPRVNE
jgi:hypothetical protein